MWGPGAHCGRWIPATNSKYMQKIFSRRDAEENISTRGSGGERPSCGEMPAPEPAVWDLSI